MQNSSKSNLLIIFVILISTLAIIGTNYIFNKQVALDINDKIMQDEYNKIGGKDNYTLLKEIQKKEILGYLNKIKKENPKLIYNIRQKSNKSPNKKFLSWESMNNIKNNSYIKGNSGANITILEFSDLECPYCIELHKEGTIEKILKNNSGSVNYVFKNFPLPKHKNSEKEAIAGKCIEKIAGGEKYLSFIDNIFKTTTGGGEGYNLNNIEKDIENLGINKEKFNTCYTDESSIKMVANEFNLGIKLGVNSTPSNLIINNTTGEYIILKGKVKESEFNDTIKKIKSLLTPNPLTIFK